MIYLDCAATSLQKPRSVYRAVQRAMETMASPGRGGHEPAMRAADMVFSCREALAELFHVPSPEQVVFTSSATHGLNIAIHALAKPGERVVVSGYEHNAVMRPLYQIGTDTVVVRSSLFDSEAMVQGFARQLSDAKLAVCTAMSNVFGFITPIQEIAALCKIHHVPLIIDASQLAGCGAIDFEALNAAFIAMPGHKGLLGPQGTGVLLCNEIPEPLLAGGTGTESKNPGMPEFLPERLEAGTHNVPGIAGLYAGVRYVMDRGVQSIAAHEYALMRAFADVVRVLPGVETFSGPDASVQAGVLSLRHERLDSELLSGQLGRAGVAVRGGMHCAPCAHETAGTYDTGTVRLSFSPFNTMAEVECSAGILKRLIK